MFPEVKPFPIEGTCLSCVHEGPKCYVRGDYDDRLSYCFKHRFYEPFKICEDYKNRFHY